MDFSGNSPQISNSAFCASNAVVIGSATVSDDANIWFGACVRADNERIYIGKSTNIQDLTIIHVDDTTPVWIGDFVTVGHGCIIHGATIEDNVLVGMGSIVMDGARIGKNTIIGAGSLIPMGKEIPSGVLVVGRPGKVIRELTEDEILGITESAVGYVEKSKKYIK
ncbi:MAG: gamma carbonic anhydrase family protein [Proteocatella sp.]